MSDAESNRNPAELDPETGFILDSPKAPAGRDDASLGQIRDILVGPLTRDIEGRVASLEQRLEHAVVTLGEKTAGTLETIQSTLSNELTAIRERLDALEQAHATQTEGAEKTRTELAEQIAAMQTDVEKVSHDLSGTLTREASAIRGEMVDRFTLATALSELAMGLSEQSDTVIVDPAEADADLDEVLGGMTK